MSLINQPDVQVFSTAGTYRWTKPAGARWVKVACVGAGTGGGSGGKYYANSQRTYLDGTGLRMGGSNGGSNDAYTPSSTVWATTGDIEFICRVSLDTWSGLTRNQALFSSNGGGNANQVLFDFRVAPGGYLSLRRGNWTNERIYLSNALNYTAGSVRWVRVVWDQNNGSNQSQAFFYEPTDPADNSSNTLPTAWTLIGNPTNADAGPANGSGVAAALKLGANYYMSTEQPAGLMYRAIIRTNPLGTPVTVLDCNFTTPAANATSFVESSSNAFTINVRGAGVARSGGGGGFGGATSIVEYAAEALPNIVDVTVGTGTAGGARQATDTTAGSAGTSPTSTTTPTKFGLFCSADNIGVGAAGGNAALGAGVPSTTTGSYVAVGGGGTSITTDGPVASQGFYVGGGAGGGSVTAADVVYAPGVPSVGYAMTLADGRILAFSGGTGGVYNGVTPGDGGAGGPGCGGGGGAPGMNGTVDSGAGGRGGDGLCIVTTYFDPINIQSFDQSGTWVKPSDSRLTTATIFVVGAGGGGGSGAYGSSGGTGGGSGGVSMVELPLSVLPPSVPVTVGVGGAGGASQSTAATNGIAGSAGALSSFGTFAVATGGSGGLGGGNIPGGTGGTGSTYTGASGGQYNAGNAYRGSSGALTAGGSAGGYYSNTNLGWSVLPLALYNILSTGSLVTGVGASGTLVAPGPGFVGGTSGIGGNNNGPYDGGNGIRGSGGGGGSYRASAPSGSGGKGGDGYVCVVCR